MHPIFLIMTILLTFAPATCQDGGAQAAPRHDVAAAAPARSAEEILTLLEEDAASLHDFEARIRIERTEPVTEEVETRTGKVFFLFDHEQDSKKFAVHFERKIIGDRMRDMQQQYIFDGVWLVEKNPQDKQLIKRQMVGPGEKLDPLKLGEGPIPLPIAQKKKDVLERFTVETIGPPKEGFLARVLGEKELYGLKLTPRPGFPEAEEFEEVRLWFDPEHLLPVGVDAVEPNDRTVVWLGGISRNEGVDPAIFDTSIPDESEGWRIDVREWDEGESDGG